MFSVSVLPAHQSREHSVLKITTRCCLMYVSGLCISLTMAFTLLSKRIILMLTQDQTHTHRTHINYLPLFAFKLCASTINRRGGGWDRPSKYTQLVACFVLVCLPRVSSFIIINCRPATDIYIHQRFLPEDDPAESQHVKVRTKENKELLLCNSMVYSPLPPSLYLHFVLHKHINRICSKRRT